MAQPKIAVDLIVAKLAEDAERSRERVQKASNVLLEPLDTEIATTPYEVVYEEDRVKLKHYHPVTEPRGENAAFGGLRVNQPGNHAGPAARQERGTKFFK